MDRNFRVAAFRDDDAGYVAVAAAAPGLFGVGNTPEGAAEDLLFRFLGSFDDMPFPPAPEAELTSILDFEVRISSFAQE